ncbi:MAG: queuosine precursor transporter [Peptococcaceae bacterium]|nr:queuosine precursor transporter [Oscillospiraceae bacterium]MBQ7025850.1 queuosine precursor transporter [Peptococcaceae bacterium]
MNNEFLLLLSFAVIYGGALLAYRLFGKIGLYAVSALATVVANIEVMIVVDAFGLQQTLGNVLFGVTFLITDILSENEGKKDANRAVYLGIFASLFFLVISQSWLLYTPADADWAMPSFRTLFTNTPRMLFASLSVYAVSQMFDVWLYHAWWDLTARKSGNSHRFLWLRNNGSTLISQMVNAVLFNVLAFWGMYDLQTLMSIIISSYVIYIFTSLLDTPFVYLARRMKELGKVAD